MKKFNINFKNAFIISLAVHALALIPSYSFSGSRHQEEEKKVKLEQKLQEISLINLQKGNHNKSSAIDFKKLKKKRSFNTELKFKQPKAELVCKGQGKGNSKVKIPEGFKEYLPSKKDFPKVPESYINRLHRYASMLEKDMYPGLSTIMTSLETLLWEPLDKADIKSYDIGDTVIYIGKVKEIFWMEPEKRQKTYDEWMEFPKEIMFERMKQMLGHFDSNHGDLAEFTRELYNQNLVRRIFRLGPDNETIDFFEESLFKAEVFNYITGYVQNSPYSRTTAELLFVLERLYKYESHMLSSMFNAQMRPNPKKDIRRHIVDTVSQKYEAKMRGMGFEDGAGIMLAYKDRRLEIMDKIIENRYRANDALFIKGRIHFSHAEVRKAYEAWQQISPAGDEFFIFKDTYEKIMPFVDEDVVKGKFHRIFDIKDILDNETLEYGDFLEERDRKFIWEKDRK